MMKRYSLFILILIMGVFIVGCGAETSNERRNDVVEEESSQLQEEIVETETENENEPEKETMVFEVVWDGKINDELMKLEIFFEGCLNDGRTIQFNSKPNLGYYTEDGELIATYTQEEGKYILELLRSDGEFVVELIDGEDWTLYGEQISATNASVNIYVSDKLIQEIPVTGSEYLCRAQTGIWYWTIKIENGKLRKTDE